MNNIIYSAIVKEKHVILCEYTEYTGNFNQMLINFIKFIQNSSYKSFKSKIIIDNYQIFCIKDNFIYYVIFTSTLEKNEENILFSFLISIKNILLNKIPLNELKNKKPLSLKNFIPILKENMLTFNENSNKFVNNSNNEIISNLFEYQPKNFDDNQISILSTKKDNDKYNSVINDDMILYNNKKYLNELLLVETSSNNTKSTSLFSFRSQNIKCNCRYITIIIIIIIVFIIIVFLVLYLFII